MNKLVFIYGEAAKGSSSTLSETVLITNSETASDNDKELAKKMENLISANRLDGATCTDSDPYTFNEKYLNQECINVDYGIKLNGTARTFSDGSLAGSCNEYLNPGEGYLYKGDTGNGQYRILLTTGAQLDVQCDMVTAGGGWTKAEPGFVTLSGANWGSNDMIYGSNKYNACNPISIRNYQVYAMKIPWTKARLDLWSRTTTLQCSRVYRTLGDSQTKHTVKVNSDGSETQYGICTWGDNVWAKSTGNYSVTGLHQNWRIYADRAVEGYNDLTYATRCSSSSDNGTYKTYFWFK
jgi:hypothetical protein